MKYLTSKPTYMFALTVTILSYSSIASATNFNKEISPTSGTSLVTRDTVKASKLQFPANLPKTRQISQYYQTVVPNGTIVTFSYASGYPSITRSYCGRIIYWNGASYDIQVPNIPQTFYRVPEYSIIRGC
ncbi:hypothetical protein [Merismopedia glauca]|uniref:Uncharacterized protein n=1 Tax=Merismopedia glauca CCAP 1448/3 TaxID=1296344 RepID=A0A2T1BYK9_9CYAN|nr:hypothetical protein C7B64_20465 [Merismopedia glauca CCAP 1448/3]